jgi:hypothetical protein
MSAPFKVGEVVEGCNHIYDTHLNGMQCEITGGLAIRNGINPLGVAQDASAYLVRWPSGIETNTEPRYLRRRKPPASHTGERMFMQQMRDLAGKAPQRVGETV